MSRRLILCGASLRCRRRSAWQCGAECCWVLGEDVGQRDPGFRRFLGDPCGFEAAGGDGVGSTAAGDAIRVVVDSLKDGVGSLVRGGELRTRCVDAEIHVRSFLEGGRYIDDRLRVMTRRRWTDGVHGLLELGDERRRRLSRRCDSRVTEDEVGRERKGRSEQELGGRGAEVFTQSRAVAQENERQSLRPVWWWLWRR